VKTRVVQINVQNPQPEVIQQAREVLQRGGLVAFPTDTLYALGANALDTTAVERVITVKGRHSGKPLSVLVPTVGVGMGLSVEVSEGAHALMETLWPGALTIVVKASPTVPSLLTAASGTIGLRMPAGPVARALLAAFGGPIIGTSANKAGGADPADAKTVQKAIGGQIDLVLDGGRVTLGVPSTVIDCTVQPARILREGAISRRTLEAKIALT